MSKLPAFSKDLEVFTITFNRYIHATHMVQIDRLPSQPAQSQVSWWANCRPASWVESWSQTRALYLSLVVHLVVQLLVFSCPFWETTYLDIHSQLSQVSSGKCPLPLSLVVLLGIILSFWFTWDINVIIDKSQLSRVVEPDTCPPSLLLYKLYILVFSL